MPCTTQQWGGPRPFAPAALAVIALAATAMAETGVADHRTVIVRTSEGPRVVSTAVPVAPATARPVADTDSAGSGHAPGDEVLWSRNLTDATYTSTGLMMPPGRLAAGTYLNPPKQVEVFDVVGDGTPVWTFAGEDFDVATAHRAGVLAALDRLTPQTLMLSKWNADSAVPDWSYEITPASPASYRAIVVSPDGSTIAVLVTRQGEVNNARLYVFDADSDEPINVFDAPGGTFGRNLDITDDGSLIAFMGGASVFVFDRDADALRYSASAGATNDAVGISGDGEYLAYGWLTMSVRRWDGVTYGLEWTRAGGQYSLRHCVLASDGRTLVAGWSRLDSTQNRVDLHEVTSSDPTWSSLYDVSSGPYQEVIWQIVVTPNGGHIAVASWGDQPNTNPELHVFSRFSPEAIFTLDTPGSLFATDLARGAGGVLDVTAAGKHVHANQSGRGGDLYAVRLTLACPADLDAGGSVDFADLLAILSAWGPCDNCPEDLDASGGVDFADILVVLSAWGPC